MEVCSTCIIRFSLSALKAEQLSSHWEDFSVVEHMQFQQSSLVGKAMADVLKSTSPQAHVT